MSLILQSLYFFLPAYLANMAPVLVGKVPVLGSPISKKIFGAHKTWRGLVIAPIVGGVVFWLQKLFVVESLWLIDYADYSILLGVLLGLGAILGDLLKSYYKRKAGIKSGKPWWGFDQLDFVIGAIVFSWFIYVPKAEVVLVLLIVSPVLHMLFNLIGYYLKFNKKMF